jgi:predicted Zn-dependent protease
MPNVAFAYRFSTVAEEVGGPTHERASLPGGYIFVPTSLILTAADKGEFAGMPAHAMSHIAKRHGTRA